MQQKPKYYFPQLDAIRGMSFLAVYFFHAFHPAFAENIFGRFFQYLYNNLVLSIDVFFILSSFLLTWLGINEYKIKGNFSFKNYFIRRVLRIWPLYYLIMIFAFLLLPYASARLNIAVTLPPPWYYLYFISNFYLEGHVFFLRFLWTLSVEEQFYLLWGISLFVFQKHLAACVYVLIGVSIIYTIYAISNDVNYYYNTLTYLFDFAIGILAAILLHKDSPLVTFFKNISKRNTVLFLLLLPLLFIVVFLITYFSPAAFGGWLDILIRYLFILYIGLFIIEQMVNEKPLIRLGQQKFLVYTGKISYGLYCFHGITLTFGVLVFQKLHITMLPVVQALVFLLANFIIASISYILIEKPFLRLKDKLRRI